MRNLKRALSLALACVMLIGMMAVSASAADAYDSFTDKDEIANQEAVSTLVTLNVINGKNDGSYYDPTGIVTRAEMAKMITIVLNGGLEPVLGVKDQASFTDIRGHWAESYIEYCTSPELGIISGRGDGSFDPGATVTASEAAKMLLTAIGYNAEVFHLTGSAWEINTNVYANQSHLYDGLNITSTAGLTRDNAAQMIYNGIQTALMIRSWNQNQATGQVTEVYNLALNANGTPSRTLLSERFGLVRVEGIVTANEVATINGGGAHLNDGQTRLASIANSSEHSYTAGIFNVSTGADELGRTVTLFVKPAANAQNDTTKAVVIGHAVVSGVNRVATTQAGYGTGKTLTDFANKNNLTADSSAVFSYNYDSVNGVNATYVSPGRGVVTTLVDNDGDGQYEYCFVVEHGFGEVTSKTTKDDGSIRISGLADTTYTSKNTVGFEDVEREEFVNYIEVGGRLYVEKAETVTGKMTQFDDKDKSYITVDGEQYGTSQITSPNMGVINQAETTSTFCATGYLNRESVFYLDLCGNIVAVGEVEGASQYAFVTAIDNSTINSGTLDTANRAKAALSGTGETAVKDVFAVDTDGNGVYTSAEKRTPAAVATLYTYTINGDDQFVLTPVTLAGGAEKDNVVVKMTKGETTVMVDGTKYFANADTAYFFVAPVGDYDVDRATISGLTATGIDSVAAYTGYTNAPSFDSSLISNALYAGKTDCLLVLGTGDEASIVKAIVVVTESAGLSGNLMYLYRYVGDNEFGQIFDVILDNEIVKNVTITSGATKTSAGMVAKYAQTKNGYSVTALGAGAITEGNITVKGDNSIVVNNEEYKINSNTVIANIDGNNTTITDVALVRGDYVTVAYDTDKTARAVYVTKPYAANNAEILDTNESKGFSNFSSSGKTADYDAAQADDKTVGKMLDSLTIPYGATAEAYKTRTQVAGRAAPEDVTFGGYTYSNGQDRSAMLDNGHYWIVVTSQDGSAKTAYDVTVSNAVVLDPTANMTFTANAGDLTGGGDTKTVAVALPKGTTSVTITGSKSSTQTVTVGGTDAAAVTKTDDDTAPTFALSGLADGASKTFTVVVAEDGKASITYTFTVTVATKDAGTNVTTLKVANGTDTTPSSITNEDLLTKTPTVTAIEGDKIKITYTATATQKVTIEVGGEKVANAVTGTAAEASSSDYVIKDTDLAKGSLTVKVTVTEDGKEDVVTNKTITIAQTKAAVPTAAAVGSDEADSNGDITVASATAADEIKLKVTAADDTTVVITGVEAKVGGNTAAGVVPSVPTAGTAIDGVNGNLVYTANADDDGVVVTVTVKVTRTGYADNTATYTITITDIT